MMDMQVDSVSFTHCGGVRSHNEDALLEAPDAGVWVVADGMGGYEAGDVASQLICESVASAIGAPGAFNASSLEQSLQVANDRIRRYGEEKLAGKILGSTVVALLIENGFYHLFWAGDSRCYMARNHQLSQLSRDHSQVAELVEQGLLREAEAESHPLAHIITRALGVDPEIALDYRSGEVAAGDVFLLCSDGVSKEFSSGELGAFLNSGNIDDASQAILHSALVNNCNDNVSCIIVNVEKPCYSGASSLQDEDLTIPVSARLHMDREF